MKAEAHDRINVQNNPVNFTDPIGLKVSVSWVGLHPTISIENASNPKLNGHYDFGPDVNWSNALPWLAGFPVDGQVGYGPTPKEGNVIYESDNKDKIVYDRIKRDMMDPPDYSWVQYNCMDWVNDMLYGREGKQEENKKEGCK